MNKHEVVKIVKSRAWMVQVFNGLPVYLHTMATSSGWMLKKDIGVNYSKFFLLMHESRAAWHYDEQDLEKIGHGYYKRYKNLKSLRALEERHVNTYWQARRKNGTPRNLNELPLKKLVALAQDFLREVTLAVGVAHAQEGISFVSEVKLNEMLNKRGRNNHDNVQLLSTPLKASFLAVAQNQLWKIRQSKGKKQKLLIQNFLKRFGLSYTSYVKGIMLKENDVLKKASLQTQPAQIPNQAKIKAAKNALIKQLKLNRQEKFVIETIEIVSKWQDDRKNFILQSIGRTEPILEEISKRVGLPVEKFKYIYGAEITLKNLQDKNFIKKLSRRFPEAAYFALEKSIYVFMEKDAKFIERQLQKNDHGNVEELKGLVANKGQVIGKVRLCLTIHDIAKVRKGEILVASMTRPEFLPAMQKAAGIVTNEGGITSHAAIVSRELGIPCIIGTKIATEVLKDGDMVEVNANLGWVKKISK